MRVNQFYQPRAAIDAATIALSPAMTNMWGWWKADAGTFNDASMTTPATSEGNDVAGWQDQSGNSRNWTQSTAGREPKLRLGVVNSRPVIRFVHTGPNFLNGPNMSSLTAVECFIVLKTASNAPTDGDGGGLWAMSGSGSAAAYYPYANSLIYEEAFYGIRVDSIDPVVSLASSFRLYNVISTGAGWAVYLDGGLLNSQGLPAVIPNAAPKLGQNIGSNAFSGDIAEMIIYSAACSTPDKTTTKAYLADKYGLTLA